MLSTQLIPLAGFTDLVRGIGGMIFLFMLVVGIHELGHLMWAKAFGVGAEEFAIGFGKRLWGFKWGGTLYSIRLIPLGGFVKIKGMIDALHEAEMREKEEASGKEGEEGKEQRTSLVKDAVYESSLAMRDLALWKKILVFSGGVINNIILALFFFVLLAWGVGLPNPDVPAVVGWVNEDVTELQRGDEILSVGGVVVSEEAVRLKMENNPWETSRQLILKAEGAPVNLEVQRGGEVVELVWADPPSDELSLINAIRSDIPAVVVGLNPHGPAVRAGLMEGDRIVLAGGKPIEHWMDLQPVMSDADGSPVEYVVERGDERLTFEITAEFKDYHENTNGEKGRWLIGFTPGIPTGPEDIEKLSVVEATAWAVDRVLLITFMSYDFLWRTMSFQTTFQEVRDNLGGPVVIFGLGYEAANKTITDFLWFAGLLNVILAIMNILPYPILDGGHILFNIMETVRGRPFSLKTLERIYGVAFFLLMALMVLVLFNDVIRQFGLE